VHKELKKKKKTVNAEFDKENISPPEAHLTGSFSGILSSRIFLVAQ
jgi:hypothetical protein